MKKESIEKKNLEQAFKENFKHVGTKNKPKKEPINAYSMEYNPNHIVTLKK